MRAALLSVLLVAGLAEAQGLPRSSSSAAITIASGIGSSPAAAGMSLSSGVLTLQPADATHPGLVTTGTQTIAGAKTFSSGLTCQGVITGGSNFISSSNQGLFYTTGGPSYYFGNPTDNSSAVGAYVGAYGAPTTAGAKLVSFANNIASTPVTKASIDKDGNFATTGFISASSGYGQGGLSGASEGLNFSGSNVSIVAGGNAFQVNLASNTGANFLVAALAGITQLGNTTVSITTGSGSPAGAVTAVVGSLYLRTDGGASTTLYVKESGTGTSGWVAK